MKRNSKLTGTACVAILLAAASTAFGLPWDIANPGQQDEFGTGATVGGNGNGHINNSFTVRVKQGTTIVQSGSGTVNAQGYWFKDLLPPFVRGGGGERQWTSGAAEYELLDAESALQDSVDICFGTSCASGE